MKNIFNNSVVRLVRDDLLKKNKDPSTNNQTSSVPSAHPTYYHHPPSNSSTTDSYSHTASSTAGYSQTNTYPSLAAHNHERDKQAIIGKIESTATHLLGTVLGDDTAVSATHIINSAVTHGHNARELLQSGCIVQLVSKSSAHLLQVVMSSNGSLVFDGNGAANSFNTYFTVEESEKGRLRFHNNCNYLAFTGKQPSIISLPPGPKNNPAIDFRVHDILGSVEFVALESCAYKNCFISVLPNGHLKTTNIKDKNIDAQFSVVLIAKHQQSMFPYQPQPYQQYNMNPYGGTSSNSPSGYTSPQSSIHHDQPSAPPPPSYSSLYPKTQPSAPSESYPQTQPSTSSGLYPQFN